jgi:DNA helicase HerA-like ATPase
VSSQVDVYEKLGAFYLGRACDPKTGETAAAPLLYDAKDLTTHAVCVGMTGSGKTGLCIALLEEAALDGVPALVIDPKGDLANLLLTFPEIAAGDFRPWVRAEDETARARLAELEAEMERELTDAALRLERTADSLEVFVPKPKTKYIEVLSPSIAWMPAST